MVFRLYDEDLSDHSDGEIRMKAFSGEEQGKGLQSEGCQLWDVLLV